VSKEIGEKPWQIEGLENCKWVLMDYVDIVVHIFSEKSREKYKLEELWEESISTQIKTKY
jgi:ribosome-associated protein